MVNINQAAPVGYSIILSTDQIRPLILYLQPVLSILIREEKLHLSKNLNSCSVVDNNVSGNFTHLIHNINLKCTLY